MAANSGGKRAGARRGPRPKRRLRPNVLGFALGITVLVIGWGYLVWLAVDFGGDARNGDSGSWTFAGVAALGAAACLFAGLMLGARLFRSLGEASIPVPRGGTNGRPAGDGHLSASDGGTVVGPGGPPAPSSAHSAAAAPTNPYAPYAAPGPRHDGSATTADHSRASHDAHGGSHRHRAG